MQMIIPGTEGRQQKSGKKKQVGPAFPPVQKMFGHLFGVEPQQEYQTPQANTCESQIGGHVTKMGQAQKTSLVGEHGDIPEAAEFVATRERSPPPGP